MRLTAAALCAALAACAPPARQAPTVIPQDHISVELAANAGRAFERVKSLFNTHNLSITRADGGVVEAELPTSYGFWANEDVTVRGIVIGKDSGATVTLRGEHTLKYERINKADTYPIYSTSTERGARTAWNLMVVIADELRSDSALAKR